MTTQPRLAGAVVDRVLVVQVARVRSPCSTGLAFSIQLMCIPPRRCAGSDRTSTSGSSLLRLDGPRACNGSVCIDLRTVHTTAFDEAESAIDISELPRPEPDEWIEACKVSRWLPTAVTSRAAPLRLAGGLLYLERYWQQEELVRVQLQRRLLRRARNRPVPARLPFRGCSISEGLAPGEADRQQLAAASALSRVSVLAGGPGTGKTTTVARLLALLRDQPGLHCALRWLRRRARPPRDWRRRCGRRPRTFNRRISTGWATTASTLHRLLGWLPSNRSRFRHDATNQLPHDVVIVDEMSMVSLTLMARLLEAVRPSARLVLVGDPDQLSSVEAGAVLADIARALGAPDTELGRRLVELGLITDAEKAPVHGVVQLTHTWRFGGAIDAPRAIRAADADAATAVLRSGATDVQFSEVDPEGTGGFAR